jgi:hypothetical protein
MYVYNGTGIWLAPKELLAGGWKADFTLIDDRGGEIRTTLYWGSEVYATRDEAKRAALDSARRIVSENYTAGERLTAFVLPSEMSFGEGYAPSDGRSVLVFVGQPVVVITAPV